MRIAALIFSCLFASAKATPPPTLRDVRYGAHERQVLDFWKADTAKSTPFVFYIHGGGWMFGDKGMVVGVERYLAAGVSGCIAGMM